jgi:hypothetical protein
MFSGFMRPLYRNRPRRSQAPSAFLAAAVALLAAGDAAASGLDCAAAPVRIATTRSMPPPTIDNSLTQPQLQLLAAHRHPGRALGLYRAHVNGRFDARIEYRWDEDEACLWVGRIALRIEAVDRRIWVIRERRPGTCDYEAVLGHERKHQQVDEAVVEAFVPRLEAALARRADALGVVRVARGGREAAQKRMLAAIDETFQAEMAAMQEERERRQEAVDTPAEYRRIGAACDPLRDRK